MLLIACPWAGLAQGGGFGGRGGGGARPSFGGAGGNFGGARPAMNVPRGGFGGNAGMPTQRPQTSSPHLGIGGGGNRTNVSGLSPARSGSVVARGSLGSRDSGATNRPGNSVRPSGNVGQDRLGRPAIGASRPAMPEFGKLPSGRPSAGDLGDFLGLDTPVGPGPNVNRPVASPANRADELNQRRDAGAVNRPSVGDRVSSRPLPANRLPPDRRVNLDVGDINIGTNTIISNKPRWVSLEDHQVNAINQRWRNQLNTASTLPAKVPDRFQDWGDAIRDRWHDNQPPGYFRPDWWARHRFRCCGWHYIYAYTYYPYAYWWSTPAYNDVVSWCNWGSVASPAVQPVYYDYGSGGNVTYQSSQVYLSGQPIADSKEFAESAALLATVDAPDSSQEAEESEWMPLGTFAFATSSDDLDPSRVVQLAINQDGIVSGTLFNKDTDQVQAIQGRVDKDTQRVALRVGESNSVVVETGLYNLTQDEASVLVHFGTETHDNCLLVRLPSSDEPTPGI
ncbi:mu-protocadherin- cell-suface protein [Rhodopirellula baltica]|nr:mu-protocadherin- cell-suface protein [Rhodopirellula baltica]